MKGIYLTEEAKAEIEAKIAELGETEDINSECWGIESSVYQEILASATILPVEKSWDHVDENTHTIPKVYPNGVIIQPKQ